ncbi:hypothetical protein CLV98_1078 [Dyadobacter jejuensis]|uniref:Uncharacterized protein n=1 Tax=Dyadobacter jejuensis TaxID=1082580 RepID=A0A316AHX7_9BACT|nr:hypothetical protein CLV98_1078 [Dyadobacter jejuensis]
MKKTKLQADSRQPTAECRPSTWSASTNPITRIKTLRFDSAQRTKRYPNNHPSAHRPILITKAIKIENAKPIAESRQPLITLVRTGRYYNTTDWKDGMGSRVPLYILYCNSISNSFTLWVNSATTSGNCPATLFFSPMSTSRLYSETGKAPFLSKGHPNDFSI